ncbi:MAG: RHS repeat-associated core domain-containing protein, partial [Bacteroidales bacterium]|nr:RHS repeat-associated core domain-containing protein [Bacteroidales bacterium]
MPPIIQHDQGHIENTYSWDGSKRRRRVFDQIGQQLSDERYFGDLVTENGLPSLILHADGYVDVSGMQPVFIYHLKDHLGNVRIVLQAGGSSGTLKQSNDYYPFGMAFTRNSSFSEEESFARENKYKYNGKEEQPMPGKWLDYGARFYDAQLGRWHSVDPLAERHYSFTAYNYALNNPLLFIDQFGLDTLNVNSNAEVKSGDVVITESGPIAVNSDEVVVNADEIQMNEGLHLVTNKDAGTNNDNRKGSGSNVNIDGLLPNVGVKGAPRFLDFIRDAINTFFSISSIERNNENGTDDTNNSNGSSSSNSAEISPTKIDSSRSVVLYWH